MLEKLGRCKSYENQQKSKNIQTNACLAAFWHYLSVKILRYDITESIQIGATENMVEHWDGLK